MAHQINTRVFRTREEAEKDQADRGQPGYSERYPLGVDEVPLTDGTTGYLSRTEEYYG